MSPPDLAERLENEARIWEPSPLTKLLREVAEAVTERDAHKRGAARLAEVAAKNLIRAEAAERALTEAYDERNQRVEELLAEQGELRRALTEARAKALRDAAQRMDASDTEVWTNHEVRDWLLFQAGRDGG